MPTWEEAKITIGDPPDKSHRPIAQNCITRGKDCYGTFPVTTAKPDENGLYDRLGNVYEWVWDWYGPQEGYCWGNDERECESKPNVYNSHGPTTGLCKRISGSSFYKAWVNSACYPPNRGGVQLGFRLVKTLH